MDIILWIGLPIIAVVLLVFAGLIALRLARPHSRRKVEEEALLNSKQAGNSTTTTSTKSKGSNVLGWLKGMWSNNLVLGIAGAVIFYWWLYTPGLRLADVGDWSWDKWIPLCAFWLITLILIVRNTKEDKELGKKLQNALHVAMLMLFLGFPGFFWAKDGLASAVVCSKASANEDRICVLKNTEETTPIMSETNNMKFCIGPDKVFNDGTVKFKRTPVGDGRFYLQFQLTKSGVEMPVTYKLFPTNEKCPETL